MAQDLKTVIILFRATNFLQNRIKESLTAYDLNVTEFGTLEALFHKGELSVNEILEKVLIANSSMSYVLQQLVQKGYITKGQDANDRRSYNVTLTPKGKALIKEVYAQHVVHLRETLDILTPEEELELQRLLKKLGKQGK